MLVRSLPSPTQNQGPVESWQYQLSSCPRLVVPAIALAAVVLADAEHMLAP
jgi:hypothetical protein